MNSIRHKILASFLLLICVYVIYAMATLMSLQGVIARADITNDLNEVTLNHDISIGIEALDRSLSSFTSVGYERYLDESKERLADLDVRYREYEAILTSFEEGAYTIPETRLLILSQFEIIDAVRSEVVGMYDASGARDVNESVLLAFDGIELLREQQVEIAQQRQLYMKLSNQSDLRSVERFKVSLILLGTLLILLACFFSLLIARGIVKRIEAIGLAAERIGSGQFDQPVSVSGSDEISRFAKSVELMRKNLLEKFSLEKRSMELEGKVEEQNKVLERQVNELQETKQTLEKNLERLEKFKDATLGREIEMIELKKKMQEVLEEKGDDVIG